MVREVKDTTTLNWRAPLLSLLLVAAFASAAIAQSGGPYQITQSVIPAGGGTSTAGTQRLDSTIGQSIVGMSSGGSFTLDGGFSPGPISSITFSISGQVTLAEGGSPLANVTLNLTGAASLSVLTDASGHYLFTNLAAGSYTVTPSRNGFSFSPSSQNITLTNSNIGGVNFAATSTLSNPQPAAGALLISEFRLSGVTSADEFIELYNNTDSPINISGYQIDALAGYTVMIPAGTVIPARGHYLVAHQSGYTLNAYATPDVAYNFDLPTDTGLVLLNTANVIVDAVGFSTSALPYREGTGLAAVNALAQYSFVRKIITIAGVPGTGRPQDTGDNAADFLLLTTDPSLLPGTAARLGAPAPANLSSPLQRNAQIRATLLDPAQSAAAPANRYRYRCTDADRPADCDANSPLGYLSIRRTYTNNTGQPVTRLRFRVVDISTAPEGTGPGGNNIAELRVLSRSGSFSVPPLVGSPITVQGLTVEQPPEQPRGGGFNTSLVTPTITLETPLSATPPNNQIRVEFLLGIVQGGNFRFLVNVEALP